MEHNWTIEQTKRLFHLAYSSAVEGKGLSYAFNVAAKEINRSVNSVRNYYYSQLKMFKLVPNIAKDLGIKLLVDQREDFDLFSQAEIDGLIEEVLKGKAQGQSVRSVIAKLSNGEGKKALRLQNKFRSMVAHHKDRVNIVMRKLSEENVPYYNPYTKAVSVGESPDNLKKLEDYITALDEREVSEFLTLMQKLFA